MEKKCHNVSSKNGFWGRNRNWKVCLVLCSKTPVCFRSDCFSEYTFKTALEDHQFDITLFLFPFTNFHSPKEKS